MLGHRVELDVELKAFLGTTKPTPKPMFLLRHKFVMELTRPAATSLRVGPERKGGTAPSVLA